MKTAQGGTPLLSRPKIEVKRDRRVSVLSVDCPDCSAGVGEKCIGGPSNFRHNARRRMAVRLDNEMRGL